jgi:hypothetical protein
MKSVWQKLTFSVEIDPSENRLSASLEGGEVLCDPIWRDLAVGVGSQGQARSIAARRAAPAWPPPGAIALRRRGH